MNAIEAVLLVIGFFSISVSFFMGKKEKAGTDEALETDPVSRDVWTEKEEELVRERIHSLLEEEKEEVLAETKEILSRKSNEKIMEFDEFSSQLMAKISHNHDEVVFMYNTLTAKEEEWKEAAAKQKAAADRKKEETRRQAEETPVAGQPLQMAEQPVQAVVKPVQPMAAQTAGQPVQAVVKPVQPMAGQPVQMAERPEIPETPEEKQPVQVPEEELEEADVFTGKPVTGLEQLARKSSAARAKKRKAAAMEPVSQPVVNREENISGQPTQTQGTPSAAMEPVSQPVVNREENINDQIVKMHRQGMSVVEISKELNVGQGEVKLTIALYGGKR